jgi:spore maturation protein CgeB
MDIAFFGSSLVSAYWNGAATYYRGILRALAERGHRITFYEPDAFDRQLHRDIPDPPWATVRVYPGDRWQAAREALAEAEGCDLLVKASGVGVFDAELEAEVAGRAGRSLVAFWDVDAPATLERVAAGDRFGALISAYDIVFTYGGGTPVVSRYLSLGARRCVPIYNALDPTTHHPAEPDQRFRADLGLLANRLPDREARIEEFFFAAARALPDRTFVLGGNGWEGKAMPPNVRAVGHVYTRDHNAFNASVGAVLNVNRDSMARFGHSPATRVFEAAGAGACIISDVFAGVEAFLAPGEEILLARDGDDVVEQLATLDALTASRIGARARKRVLAQHTYAQRALEVERALEGLRTPVRTRAAGAELHT